VVVIPSSREARAAAHGPNQPGVPGTPAVGTDATQPGMPAVRPPVGVSSAEPTGAVIPQTELFPAFDDSDVTEVFTRPTDFGEPPVAPGRCDRALFLRMDGVNAGQAHPLPDGSCTIGRHPGCEVRLSDPGISRHHARVHTTGALRYIEDLGSSNGTFVQGRRVTQSILTDGAWIQLGPRVNLRYSLVDAQHEELLNQLFESSTRDALTGAYNRKHFDERLRAEIAYCARHNTETALVLIDIDHFKAVNDRYGHPAGDVVLRQVSQNVQRRLRAEDLFARFGGEEFAVILRETDRAGAAQVAERLRATCATVPALVDGRPIPVTISIGCATLSCCQKRTMADLVQTADRRLYLAKRGGRNRVVATG
jgi:diguanylate cyclase (GGDEF)-like protein